MRKIEYIHVNLLHPHPDNPRKDLGDLTELAESINAKGVLQNLTVVPAAEGGYRIIIGHRRHAAAKLAGLTDLPCVVADMTPQEQFETMMVENVQRSDLTVYEQAEGFQMMLDMGSSVEEVAAKTGFSASTIRNRVKLTRLDKDKFRKAEKRGATLADYLKLNEIQDPERRNKVLDTIGTPNFTNTLKNALEEQKFDEKFEATLAMLKAADWIKEKTDEDITYNGDYKSYKNVDRWNFQRAEITMPKDTDVASYIYSVTGKTIYIYRKGPASEKKKSPEEEKRERYRKAADKINKQLESISKTHREMREEFVQNFTQFNSSQMDIEAFAANALCSHSYGTPDITLLGKVTGCPVITGKYSSVNLDKEIWNKMLFNQPLQALLGATYARLERPRMSYSICCWNDKVGFSVPKHQKEDALDLIYDGLVSLGYEMSEEEIQMQNGKHPLFKEAAELILSFKKEKV